MPYVDKSENFRLILQLCLNHEHYYRPHVNRMNHPEKPFKNLPPAPPTIDVKIKEY
ncbi:hypothetical protein CLV81_3062 [Flagellimonas meridianipacifica]|uniref:Uncharacterized protein n=1 Tax=Flagellimonas meridianipacifica TaxID=1080225 RepID=A0A2T0MAY1_9FLAO|nr:hypothetical protein CLV81_3062 [Allomuricauda pacifica]